MFLMGERPEYVDQILSRLRKISEHMLASLPEPVERVSLPEVTDLYAEYNSDSLFVVESGSIHACQNGRSVIVFEPGDLVGLNNAYGLPSPEFSSDEYVILGRYDATTLLKHLTEDRDKVSSWTAYLVTLSAVFGDAYSRIVKTQTRPNTGFLQYKAGDVIIAEGDEATEVYTIIQGQAEVSVDGIKVGDVLRDEIFGAMAVFTQSKRSATVTATEPCSVLAVPKNEFVSLMQTHPETTLTLIENMARNIINLNAQLVQQQDKSNTSVV